MKYPATPDTMLGTTAVEETTDTVDQNCRPLGSGGKPSTNNRREPRRALFSRSAGQNTRRKLSQA
eukprot:2723848-Pyramimonas_sp.AAC.1